MSHGERSYPKSPHMKIATEPFLSQYIANDVAFLTQCLVFVECAQPDGIIKLFELRLDIGHEDSSAPIVALSIHFHDKSSTYFTVPTKMRSNQLPMLALANDSAWGV